MQVQMQSEDLNEENSDKKKKLKAVETSVSKCCAPCNAKEKVRLSVYLTVMLFSMSTWIAIGSIFVELPLLVEFLPEAWSLPSHLVIIIQCANIGPAIYTTVQKLKSGKSKTKQSAALTTPWFRDLEIISIFVIILVSALSVLTLSIVWDFTIQVRDSFHSIPLFLLVCVISLVSCTSSVVFLPYMARFKAGYISAYYVGMGLTSMIPGLLGLVQGLGQAPNCVFHNETILNGSDVLNVTLGMVEARSKQPLFSVSIFFGIITMFLIFSMIAFCFLNFTPVCRKEMVASQKIERSLEDTVSLKDELVSSVEKTAATPFLPKSSVSSSDEKAEPKARVQIVMSDKRSETESSVKRRGELLILLTYVGVLSGLTNSLIPASLSYTCLPYGRITYMLSVRLTSVAAAVASLSTLFLPEASLFIIHFLMLTACAIAVFLLVLAGYSPNRVLTDLITGQTVIVITSVLMMSSFSYVRVLIASKLRKDGGRKSLLWCGGITQLGSFCGALLAFVLIQVLHLFKSHHSCERN